MIKAIKEKLVITLDEVAVAKYLKISQEKVKSEVDTPTNNKDINHPDIAGGKNE